MLASLDWQRNRRGMIQAFVSHADGGHLPLRWTSSSRNLQKEIPSTQRTCAMIRAWARRRSQGLP